MQLTNKMIDAAKETPAGQYLDRLIAEDVAKGGGLSLAGGPHHSIIEQLWNAMCKASPRREYSSVVMRERQADGSWAERPMTAAETEEDDNRYKPRKRLAQAEQPESSE